MVEELFDPVPCHRRGAAQEASEFVVLLVSSSKDWGVTHGSTRYRPRSCTGSCRGAYRCMTASCAAFSASRRRGTIRTPYRMIAEKTFAIASEVDGNPDWFVNDRAPVPSLRALDKLMWWVGGGDAGTAAEVRDPWRVIRALDQRRP